jgi:site-specific DNA recombinase
MPLDITVVKVIAYCRVSTDNQKEEGTVELQEQAIIEYCNKHSYQLIQIFKDEGVSGGIENRPALASLFSFIESAQGEEINAVVIWKLDRLARDLYIQEHLIKKLEQLNKKLISTKETDLDSADPMRKAFRQFMGIVSELEKAFITMRLSGGRLNKARKGGYAGGRVALGYTSKNKELQKKDDEAAIISLIFKMKKNNHYSMNEIARNLNAQNKPTKRGGKWYPSTVAYILKNSLYKGKYTYRDVETRRNDLKLL